MNQKVQSFAKVAVLPGVVTQVTFEGHEISVADALKLAKVTVAKGYEVRTADGAVTDYNATMIQDRGVVTVAQQVKNG